MLLLADENLPRSTVEALRQDGHDVFWIRSHAPGSSDPGVLERAETEGRLLLTLDKDLLQIAMQRRQPISRCGIMLFRLHPAVAARLTPLVRRVLATAGEGWRAQIITVTPDGIQMLRARDRG